MFYDHAKVYIKGGDGGNGIVAFRREKYIPEGGPAGGDGGNGANVVFIGDEGLTTLVDFKYKRHYKADRGDHGLGKNQHGKNAENLVIRVPLGTLVRNAETKALIADITVPGQEVAIARGGRGGKGNSRFASAHDKAPAYSEKGEPGEELWVELELKLLADVGLIGYPNAGKSTLIAKVSAARPKIANYPFTTITPNLGVVSVGEKSFVVADVPGLIEGAHTGTGLGHKFLRHVERTRVLVHVLDMAGTDGRQPWDDFEIINQELALYNPLIAQRPQIIAANKMDMPESEENLRIMQEKYADKYTFFPISALTGDGVNLLLYKIVEMLDTLPIEPPAPVEDRLLITLPTEEEMRVTLEDDVYVVRSKEIERIVAMTDINNDAAVERLQRIMGHMEVEKKLKEHGVQLGSTVRIGKMEFEFYE